MTRKFIVEKNDIRYNPWTGAQLIRKDDADLARCLLAVVNPSCPHCVRLMPELDNVKGDVYIYDITQISDTTINYKVKGVPSLFIVRGDGTLENFLGARQAEAINERL